MEEKPFRVLLADDHPGFRAGIRLELEKEPDLVVVGEAETGALAIKLTKQLMPDVLLLDMELPDITGVEVAQILRKENIKVFVLPLSGFRDPEYVFALLENGAAGYMTKDESLSNIVSAVRAVARGGVYISPRVALEIVDERRHQRRETTLKQELRDLGINRTLLEVLQYVAKGLSNREIADKQQRSEHTIRNHVDRLRVITGENWRPAVVAWAWRQGVMDIDPSELDNE